MPLYLKAIVLIVICFYMLSPVAAYAQTAEPSSEPKPLYNQLTSAAKPPVFVRPTGTSKGPQPFNLKAMIREKKKRDITKDVPLSINDSRITRLSSTSVTMRREKAKKERETKQSQDNIKENPASKRNAQAVKLSASKDKARQYKNNFMSTSQSPTKTEQTGNPPTNNMYKERGKKIEKPAPVFNTTH